MDIPKQAVASLFSEYQVEGYINIFKNSKRSLSYDPLHDEISFDEKESIDTTLSVIKNHKKSVFRMDGFSLSQIRSALQDISSVIEFGEYDEDIILPKMENIDNSIHDFSCDSLNDVPFSHLENLFEIVKNFPLPDGIYLESFSASIHRQTHIFLSSADIYQEQKSNESSFFIEYF